MKFNLLDYGYLTVSGTPSLDLEDVQNILAVSGTTIISGSLDHNLTFYGDLVDRVSTYQMRYYFDSVTSSGTVASGISFYYKDEAEDSYSLLTTNIGSGYYYTTIPGLSAPRYVKLNHDVSSTSIVGTVVGLEVLNHDTVIDFGIDGSLESDTTLTSLIYLNYNDVIKQIPIFNNGTSAATAHVFLDPQCGDVDSLISISDSTDGPWVFSRNEDYIVANGDNFEAGRYYDTYTVPYTNEWNPDDKSLYYITLSENNLKATSTNNVPNSVRATQGIYSGMHFSKKWYWEIYMNNVYGDSYPTEVGISTALFAVDGVALGNSSYSYSYRSNGDKGHSSSYTSYGDSYDDGDIIGIALDMDEGKLWFSKNGVWQNSGIPASGTGYAYSGVDINDKFFPTLCIHRSGYASTANFAAPTYEIPEGFFAFENLKADGKLRLYSQALVGNYTTPIFKNDSARFAYVDVDDTSVSGSIIAVDVDDYTSTLEIRSSNIKPIDYKVYREIVALKTGTFTGAIYYKDYFVGTDVETYNSYNSTGDYIDTYNLGSSVYRTNYSAGYINNTNGKFVLLYSWSYSNYGDMIIYLLSKEGYVLSSLKLRDNNMDEVYTYYLDMGTDDDFWIYMYSESELASIGYSSGGYYLFHFDSDMNRLYEERQDDDFILGCDVIKDGTNALWCSRIDGTQGIYKLSSSGAILSSYTEVTNPGRLCTASDYGCWFIDDGVLYKLDSDGDLESSIEDLEINDELTWVMRDRSDSNFLWIVDGAYIKLIYIDGRVYKTIDFSDFTITKLYSTKDYLIVYCTDIATGLFYTKLIGRASGGVDKTIQNDTSDNGYALERIIKSVDYDNYILGDLVPLDDDSVWNDGLTWNKVVTNNAVLPREEYHQLRLTLRREDPTTDSPTVDAIYYQDSVTLTNIQPGRSEILYLKISLPDGVTIGGDYTSNLRVWWELPVV